MKTLEDYFKTNGIDHIIRCFIHNDKVSFYIHPANIDGETLDFFVSGNTLTPVFETKVNTEIPKN